MKNYTSKNYNYRSSRIVLHYLIFFFKECINIVTQNVPTLNEISIQEIIIYRFHPFKT